VQTDSEQVVRETDVLVVGGGLAGLMAALQLPADRVLVTSKVYPNQSHSGAAQGGFNAAGGGGDSVERHVADTVKGSDYLADQTAVEVMCEEAPDVIAELDRLGAMWSRNDDGQLARRRLGGSSAPRARFAADMSGHVVLQTLYEQILRRRIPVMVEWHLLGLLTRDHRVVGGMFWNLADGRFEVVRAAWVILATGGYGRVFARTTNGLGSTGDGVALAYRAGAVLSDMEFVQFHPTSLVGTNILVSEGARSEGGQLRNAVGERFMARHAPTAMELAPRDVVSRAIQREINEGRGFHGGYVHLDLTHLGAATIAERLPQVSRLASTYAGVDVVRQPLPIEPAQHYSMGGIRTDGWGATAVEGLFAAGECANVSVHGANRLGGNSLLETVVFGRRAGRYVAQRVGRPGALPDIDDAVTAFNEEFRARFTGSGPRAVPLALADIRRRLAEVMTRLIGVFRTGSGMATGLSTVRALKHEHDLLRPTAPEGGFDYRLIADYETGFLLECADVIAASALRRAESRGAHFRADCPERDDRRWLVHTFAQRGPDGPDLHYGKVEITRYPPEARSY
jgi:succinate dehydrogenase / fumarate reductase flavoprotein subunit